MHLLPRVGEHFEQVASGVRFRSPRRERVVMSGPMGRGRVEVAVTEPSAEVRKQQSTQVRVASFFPSRPALRVAVAPHPETCSRHAAHCAGRGGEQGRGEGRGGCRWGCAGSGQGTHRWGQRPAGRFGHNPVPAVLRDVCLFGACRPLRHLSQNRLLSDCSFTTFVRIAANARADTSVVWDDHRINLIFAIRSRPSLIWLQPWDQLMKDILFKQPTFVAN